MVPAATAAQVVQIVVTLLAHGYPLQWPAGWRTLVATVRPCMNIR